MPVIKVLLAEGDAVIADRILSILADAQYKTEIAADGRTAKRLFDTNGYDIALIDLHLPDIDGRQLCYYIRGRNINIPMLALSSGKTDKKMDAFQAGVDDYLALSDDLRELMMRVRALARRAQRLAVGDYKLSVRDIVMDLERKEVWKKDKPILLSAREFLLLQYLIRNKNRIVSRNEIAFNIWADGSTEKEKRVAAFVNSLRNKLGDDHRRMYLYTVMGKGYLLAEPTERNIP